MRRVFLCALLGLLLGTSAQAATYYVSTTGSDSGNGSSGQPWATFSHAFGSMSPCDTLIVNDGAYAQRMVIPAGLSGNSGCYTTIQAANDWGATIDGSSVVMVNQSTIDVAQNSAYFVIRGLKAKGNPSAIPSGVINVYVGNHIKLLKVAGYNSPCSDNVEVIGVTNSSYVLVEDSHAWGCGRYKFESYESDHVIFRHNVARHDYHDPTNFGNQSACFTTYNAYLSVMENNICLDSSSGTNGNIYGGIWSESNNQQTGHGTDGWNTSGVWQGNIILNVQSGNYGAAINDPKLDGTREILNTAIANSNSGFWGDRQSNSGATSANDLLVHHMTVVNISGTHSDAVYANGTGGVQGNNSNYTREAFQDSIFQGVNDHGLAGYLASNYNLFYNNTANFGASWYQGATPTAGANDLQGANPQLKYITRVEAGSPAKGTASDGGDRGATILYRIGTPGTLWGETGYDTATSTPLWPWDDEAVIKADMASYNANGINGARGFAASGNGLYGGPVTLTSYVWEALGNACPGDCKTQSAFLPGGSGVTNYTVTVNTPTGGTVSGANCTTGTYASGTNIACTATPNSGYTFAGWSGACSGTGACSFTLSANSTVTATFNPSATNYSLAVSSAGSGSGTISGTNCTSGTYASGTTVTCTDTPGSGSTFAGWSGACTGTGACSFALSANSTVTATFNTSAINYSLAVSSAGSGSGTISGTNCTSGTYASGTTVICTDTPGTGSTFAGWSGACSGTGACSFALSANSTVTATFNGSSSPLSLGLGTCSSTMTGTQSAPLSGCTLAASGGTPPYRYSWKVVTDGSYASLPEGLSLGTSTGAISGTSYGQGRYVPQFVVTDSVNATATLSTLVFSLAGNNNLAASSLFPSDSIFHQRVDALPVDTSAAAPIPASYQTATIKPFFGNTGNGNLPNGIPFVGVPYNQANITVVNTWDNSTTQAPIPAYSPVEGTSNIAGGDRHVLVVKTAGGGNPAGLWEMYQGAYSNPGWTDVGITTWSNLGSTGTGAYQMLPQGQSSSDAAGLPVAPLLLNADEVIGTGTPASPNGAVRHPVRFTISQMLNKYVWPGTHHSGGGSCSGGYSDSNGMILQGSGAPTSCTQTGPSGEIYRLKDSVATPACAATSPQAAIIIQGFRNYGIILADNGTSGGLIGTPDARWNDTDLSCLRQLTLANFEPVNVSGVAAALTPNYNGSGYSAPVTSYQTTSGTPALTAITVTPATASLVAGSGTQQYAAQCTYSNNINSDCTSTVTWSSSNTAAATITSSGLASAAAAGTATIKAASGTISATATLTVISPTLTAITLTPATASIVAATGTQQYAAQCAYSNNTFANCTSTVTWSSSNLSSATITAGGLASAAAVGSSSIKATSGSVSGSATLTVIAPPLTSITITPATASIVSATGTQQYAAQCSYSNNTTANCTSTVTWSSSDTATVTISSTGLASAVAAGTATIKAISGSISATATLTVTNSTLTTITVTPTTASIVAGTGTQQYAAQCSYSNNSSANCTATVTWSSSNTAAATISSGGLASAGAAGNSTIKAISGSVSGSAVLTVTDVPVNLADGLWAWMGGSSTIPAANKGQPGVYNALATPAANSAPGSRSASVGWTDVNGNLWLFGGAGFDEAGVKGYLNDLWEFQPSLEQWAWRGGRSSVPRANQGWPGVYGTQGVPNAANSPGSRRGSVSWTDNSGNFWLFGGTGYDSAGTKGKLNDLWEFDPTTREWTWWGGSSIVPSTNVGQPGVYGQPGVPDPANTPGGRSSASSWTDKTGNLWLFGGLGYDAAGSLGWLNDLWQLDLANHNWVWMGGSSTVGSLGGRPGIYGVVGSPSTTDLPSGRGQAVSWTDASGSFWLFGGKGYDSTGTLGYLNDLWQFNPTNREWAWMGGSDTVGCAGCGRNGVYGTQGQADSVNIPGGRNHAVGWTDNNGNLWLLGGTGYDSANTFGTLNDLWEFLPSNQKWAWMGGSSTVPAANQGHPGIYGQIGIPAAADTPGARTGTYGWNDNNGNLWLLGGSGYDAAGTNGTLNDLWVYQPTPGNLPAATPSLSVASGTYSSIQTVSITDVTPGAKIYYTTDGTTPGTDSSPYNGPIAISSNTTIKAMAAAENYRASAIASATYTINPDFRIAPLTGSPTNVAVQTGGEAKFELVVTPVGGPAFIKAVTLTATGLPEGATAAFAPSSLAAGLGATNVSLTVRTSTRSAANIPTTYTWTAAAALSLLFLPLPWAGWRKSRENFHSYRRRFSAGILLLAGSSIAMGGCSGFVLNNNPRSAHSTPTAHTVTITATSGSVQRTTTVTVTIQ